MTGSVPHSLCMRGQGAASQLSGFQNTLPLHAFQTGFTVKLVLEISWPWEIFLQ